MRRSARLLGSAASLVLMTVACSGGAGDDAGSGGAPAADGSGGSAGEGWGGGGSAGESGMGGWSTAADRLTRAVEQYEADVPFTLLLGDEEGTYFEASHGTSSADTVYESASTSKWVAAAVILHMTAGILELDTRAAEVLPFWTDDPDDWRSEVTLEHLLSFTSGLQPLGTLSDLACVNLPSADFDACVQNIYEQAGERTEAPGTAFVYGSHHMQVAGLMAVTATSRSSFGELFADFQDDTGLFPTSAFDLPSANNPRLAGGMHWTGREYMEFLRAVHVPTVLDLDRTAFAADRTPSGEVEMLESPAWTGIREEWHYCLGSWRECPSETWQEECLLLNRYSSPGAYGAYPVMDFGLGYHAILARQGALGTFPEGLDIFRDLEPLIEAVVASEAP